MPIVTTINNAEGSNGINNSATDAISTNNTSSSSSSSSSRWDEEQAQYYYKNSTTSNLCTSTHPQRSQITHQQQQHPGPYDVLCDRSISSFNNVGNKRFRVLCEIYIPLYTKAKTKRERSNIFRTIVDTVHQGYGKFLAKATRRTASKQEQAQRASPFCWEEVCDSRAREKVGHTLRAALVAIQSATDSNGSPRIIYDVIDDRTEHYTRRNLSVSSLEPVVSFTTHEKKESLSNAATSPKKAFHNDFLSMKLLDCHLKSMLQDRLVHPSEKTRSMMQTADSSDEESLKHSRHQQDGVQQPRYMLSEPDTFDVLCDKNRAAFHHTGNKRFRTICKNFVAQYKEASTKGKKGKLFKKIVAIVHESGGKFLTKPANSETWEEVSSVRRAKEKVGHALRAALKRSNGETDQGDDEIMTSSSLSHLLMDCQHDVAALLSINQHSGTSKHSPIFFYNDHEEVNRNILSLNYSNEKESHDSIFSFPDIQLHEQKDEQQTVQAPANGGSGDLYQQLFCDLDEHFHWDTPSAPHLDSTALGSGDAPPSSLAKPFRNFSEF